MTKQQAWLAFSWSGVGAEIWHKLLEVQPDLAAAWQDREAIMRVIKISPARRHAILENARALNTAQILLQLDQLGIHYVCSFEDHYPAQLQRIEYPPPLLYIQGNADALLRPSVSIVGSRLATEYGKRQTTRFAEYCARRGLVIVSGLAFGIDTAAHLGAIGPELPVSTKRDKGETGSTTSVAVVAGGLGIKLMSWQDALAKRIIQAGGAIVSEFPPDVPALKHHFPARNRIIAGLSPVTLVGEARERSGALITARLALECGSTVMCIPHDLERSSAAGSNRLIRDGATVALEPEDVVQELIRQLPESALHDKAGPSRLLSLLERPQTHLEISTALEISSTKANKMLLDLELSGAVTRGPDGRYSRARS